tara:strand:+ start:6035 stop:6607 length:573 start_codon:yes stop_codon:yes gene_type:complete
MIYKIPIQIIFALAVYFVYGIPGKLLGLVMIPIGIWTDWQHRFTWPWDAATNPKTGTYYDTWYPDMDAPQHTRHSRFFYNAGEFWREYYWRIRNSFSNAMRYTFTNPNPKTNWRTMMEGCQEHRGDGWYYQYHKEQWWYARYRYSKRTDGDQGWEFYIGWKLDRWDGFGLTVRIPKKNFIPADQDYGADA